MFDNNPVTTLAIQIIAQSLTTARHDADDHASTIDPSLPHDLINRGIVLPATTLRFGCSRTLGSVCSRDKSSCQENAREIRQSLKVRCCRKCSHAGSLSKI